MAVFFDPCVFMAVRCFLHVSVEPIRWVVVRPYLHYILWEEMISIRYTAQRTVYDRAGFCTGDVVVWTNGAVWIPTDQAKVHSILDHICKPFVTSYIRECSWFVGRASFCEESRSDRAKFCTGDRSIWTEGAVFIALEDAHL